MQHLLKSLVLAALVAFLAATSTPAHAAGNITNLAGAIDYSDQHFVKKPIFKGGQYTILLFAFQKGQRLPAHTIPIDAFIQVLEGTATVIIDDQEYEVKAGEKIDLPKNLSHALTARENFKMLLVK